MNATCTIICLLATSFVVGFAIGYSRPKKEEEDDITY